MRILLCLALFALPALLGGVAAEPVPAQSSKERFIVHLESPAAAVFEGFGSTAPAAKRALAPTHAATAGKLRFDSGAAEVKAYRAYLANEQGAFEAEAAKALGRPLKPEFKLDLVLNAVVLTLTRAEAETVSKLQGVSRVEPDFVRQLQSDAGPAWINAPLLWSGGVGAPTRGEGVVIGVIDSGINASHPSFAGVGPVDGHRFSSARAISANLCASPASPPCTGKLIGVRDFTTGGTDAERNDGSDVSGHGSHVASIAGGNVLKADVSIAAQMVEREISGVAPHASLISYKACEEVAECAGSWLLAAINAAVADGVDIINYSIGGDPRDPWSSSDALALLAAREAGIVPVVAAGNEGPSLGSVTSPGNAPWVISVANASHNRSIGSRLIDFTGGSAPPPDGGSLLGASGTAGFGPARIVVPDDFPGCSIGSGSGLDLTNRPDGSSNPWRNMPNRFNGEIVVCLRGTQARIAKGDNVRQAGAGGMILVNTVGDAESIVADVHTLPATHIGFRAGEQLRQWLAAGGERARIEGARLFDDVRIADRLAASSGRGPVAYGGVMLPSIAAPGTDILAAAGVGPGTRTLSGTSMASPHVAGAAALLRALKPEWRVDQIQSALMTTGRSGLRREDDVRPARRIDVGAGGLDVGTAALAQLHLITTGAEFRAANPNVGGLPRTLNLPGLMHEKCFESCRLSRRVRDLAGGGRWAASAELPGGSVRVQPAEFQLNAGSTQALELAVSFDSRQGAAGWLDGQVLLTRLDGSTAGFQQRLPLAVFMDPGDVPERIDRDLDADAGFIDIAMSGLLELDDLTVGVSRPTKVISEQRTLIEGSTPASPFLNIDVGVQAASFVVPAATAGEARTFLLQAQVSSATAVDLDLYVGIDYNGNGRPDEAEKLCTSASPGSSERCKLEIPQTGTQQNVWVLVHSYRSGGAFGDVVQLEAALFDTQPADGLSLVATAPSQVASREPFNIRLSWNDPTWLRGEVRGSLLSLSGRPGAEPFARIPLILSQQASAVSPRQLLSGRPLRIRLPAAGQVEGLFVDVPAVNGLLSVSVEGDSRVRLSLAAAGQSSGPQIDGWPATGSQASFVTGNPAIATASLLGLSPGRWYVQVANGASAPVELSITANISASNVAPRPRFGSWYNPDRSGSGFYLFPAGGNWGFLWYTYLQDGTPTWYTGSAPAPTGSTWVAPASRAVWNGTAARLTDVGQVSLSFINTEHMRFNYELDGQTGSEPVRWIGGQGCPQSAAGALDLSGLWFDAANSGFGYSLDASPELESVGQFLYDRYGVARWVLANGQPFNGAPLQSSQFSGSCPLCDYAVPQSEVVGSLQVTYAGGSATRVRSNLQFATPLSGAWSREHALTRLSDTLGCSP